MWVRGKHSELTGHTSANSGDNDAEQQHGIKPLRPVGEKEQHPRVPSPTSHVKGSRKEPRGVIALSSS